MEIITGLIAAGIGYWIFHAREKQIQERQAALAEWRLREEELRRQEEAQRTREQERVRALEAERIARKTPFASAAACFQKEYVSFSRLTTYAACPRRFKLIYLDRHEPAESDWIYGRGSLFHSIAEDCLRRNLGRKLEDRTVSTLLKGRRGEVRELNLRRAVRFLCRTFPQEPEIIGVEHELSFAVGNIRFYGIVDAIVRYPDGTLEIIDYKTGKTFRPVREQLEIYCLPFAQGIGPGMVRLRYMLVDRGCHYCWSLNSSQVEGVRAHILGLVQTILDDDHFSPVVGAQCKRCGVKEHCAFASFIYLKPTIRSLPRRLRFTPVRVMVPENGDLIYEEPAGQTELRGAVPRVAKPVVCRDKGKRFDLVRASRDYVCSATGIPIKQGEYHFASHRGERLAKRAFFELFRDSFEEKMKSFAEKATPLPDETAPRRSRAYPNALCAHCGDRIEDGRPYKLVVRHSLICG